MLRTASFAGRKKHPPPDPVNALLSFGYVLLTNEIASLLEAHGFDPFIGFFHGIRYGRQSLPLDIVEPFRQPVIDRLTLRLFNRRQFTPEDFEIGETGCRLTPDALERYLTCYEQALAASSGGKGTPSWREVIKDEISKVKATVMEGLIRPVYCWKG